MKLPDRVLIGELTARILELHRRTHGGAELDPAGVVESANAFITAHDPTMSDDLRAGIREQIADYLLGVTR